MLVGGELNGVEQMGQEKFTEEIKNTHKVSVWSTERRGSLGDLGLDEMFGQCDKQHIKITIPIAFHSVKYKFFLRYISSANGKKIYDN